VSRIASVWVCVARVPLDRITSFSNRTLSARDYCLVKVRSTEGVEGIGYCYAGSSAGSITQGAVEELLAPKLLGEESTRVEGLWEAMYREALLQGRSGSVMRAISALDNALWDLNARAVGLPLYSYLGCWAKDRVPAYASGGYYLEGKSLRGWRRKWAVTPNKALRRSRSKSAGWRRRKKKHASAPHARQSALTSS